MKRVSVVTSLIMIISLAFAAPALAAAPSNDSADSPTVIASLPFIEDPALVTTEATPDGPDACGWGNAFSVWYTFTTGDDPVTLIADTSSSDYPAVITVLRNPTDTEAVNCGFGNLWLEAEASTMYYFMVAACSIPEPAPEAVSAAAIGCEGPATGGQLVFSLEVAPPPPTLDVTVNPNGKFNKSGSATITGTLTCTDAFGVIFIVDLRQQVGRFSVIGQVFVDVFPACDGTPEPWSIEVPGITGKFKGGQATLMWLGSACGSFECTYPPLEGQLTIRLKG